MIKECYEVVQLNPDDGEWWGELSNMIRMTLSAGDRKQEAEFRCPGVPSGEGPNSTIRMFQSARGLFKNNPGDKGILGPRDHNPDCYEEGSRQSRWRGLQGRPFSPNLMTGERHLYSTFRMLRTVLRIAQENPENDQRREGCSMTSGDQWRPVFNDVRCSMTSSLAGLCGGREGI